MPYVSIRGKETARRKKLEETAKAKAKTQKKVTNRGPQVRTTTQKVTNRGPQVRTTTQKGTNLGPQRVTKKGKNKNNNSGILSETNLASILNNPFAPPLKSPPQLNSMSPSKYDYEDDPYNTLERQKAHAKYAKEMNQIIIRQKEITNRIEKEANNARIARQANNARIARQANNARIAREDNNARIAREAKNVISREATALAKENANAKTAKQRAEEARFNSGYINTFMERIRGTNITPEERAKIQEEIDNEFGTLPPASYTPIHQYDTISNGSMSNSMSRSSSMSINMNGLNKKDIDIKNIKIIKRELEQIDNFEDFKYYMENDLNYVWDYAKEYPEDPFFSEIIKLIEAKKKSLKKLMNNMNTTP
jgi:hypothetical protein